MMTLEQIRMTGLKALSRELGPVGLVRFLQQFETVWQGALTWDDTGACVGAGGCRVLGG